MLGKFSRRHFCLGTATSAYQIEGAVHRRVPSSAYSSVTKQIIALFEETTQLAITISHLGSPTRRRRSLN